VNPIYDNRLGELLAVAEALVIATHQIDEAEKKGTVEGKTVVVRIFNDNMFNLRYLWGQRQLDDDFLTLARPVLELIKMHRWGLQHNSRTPVELEMHWIPGHNHRVEAHRWADELAKGARAMRLAYSSERSGDPWYHGGESRVVGWLKYELSDSAAEAGMDELPCEFSPSRVARRSLPARVPRRDVLSPAPRRRFPCCDSRRRGLVR
jgi:hypothetical protein